MNSTTTANSTEPLSYVSPELFQKIYFVVTIGTNATLLIYFMLMFPFGAVLLKYRTNYVPKGPGGDTEGDKGECQQRSRAVAKSYFGTFHRVLRVEGWSGLYKGLAPSLIKQLIISCAVMLVMLNRDPEKAFPEQTIKSQFLNKLFMMIFSLPVTIIINRAITTQSNLPWFGPCRSLRILLTERERRRPWLLYLTPGVFVTDYAFEVYNIILPRIISVKLVTRDASDPSVVNPWRKLAQSCGLLAYFVFITTVECLYNNVFARLSVQRDQPESRPVAEEKALQEKNTNLVYDTDHPYAGFFDCVRRVIKEEGHMALLRAWWYDFVPKFVTLVAALYLIIAAPRVPGR